MILVVWLLLRGRGLKEVVVYPAHGNLIRSPRVLLPEYLVILRRPMLTPVGFAQGGQGNQTCQ